jgi:hypothetical protein
MGDRSNLYFKNGEYGIGVYGHWAGPGMAEAAVRVLQNPAFKARIGDASYATRIGVQTVLETLGASASEETGFGIWSSATGPDDNGYRFLVIDVQSGQLYAASDWKNPTAQEELTVLEAAAIAEAMQAE